MRSRSRALVAGITHNEIFDSLHHSVRTPNPRIDPLVAKDSLIYKVLSRDEAQQARERGHFDGSAVDVQDGFIHFSTGDQLPTTLARHFTDEHGKLKPGLVVWAVDPEPLGSSLRWEPSRGGADFPHLYAPLDIHLVESERDVVEKDLDEG